MSPTAVSLSAPSIDAEHLLRVVETQPSCLMRVGIDGLILAANDASLGLLGAQQPAQVLGAFLTTWVVPAHQYAWREFSESVASGRSHSVECDLTDLSGTNRSVVFHGVPLVDHPDGIPSLILSARDATVVRHLEAALQESEAIRQKLAAERSRDPSEGVPARLLELEAKLEEAETDRDELERALSRLPQLEQLLKKGAVHLEDLRTRLDDATKERNQLASRLSEREAANEQLWTEQAHLQQQLADLHAKADDTSADRDRLALQLSELETSLEHYVTEHSDLNQVLEDHRQQLAGARAQIEEACAERDRLTDQLRERGLANSQEPK